MKKKLRGFNLVNFIIAQIDALLSNWVMHLCASKSFDLQVLLKYHLSTNIPNI
jgi:hypothetical protein